MIRLRKGNQDSIDYKPDWSAMTGAQKAGYIWDYYKIPIIAGLVILYLTGYFVYRHATRTTPVLCVDAVNVIVSEKLSHELTDSYTSQPGYGKRDCVLFESGLFLTEDEQTPAYAQSYAMQMKLLASIVAGQLDVVLMDREAFDIFSRENYLMDLSALTKKGSTGSPALPEDIAADFVENTAVLSDNADLADADPSVEHEAETVTAPYGIDLSRTKLLGRDTFDQTVYLGIIADSKRLEEAVKYIEYLYAAPAVA